jgi:hypothetical protein
MRKQGFERRNTDEIVAAILRELGIKPGGDIEAAVRKFIRNGIAVHFAPPAGFRKTNIESAEYILDWIDRSARFVWKFEDCGAGDREVFLVRELVPSADHFLTLWGPERVAALDQEGLDALDKKSFGRAFNEAIKRHEALTSMLEELRARCHRILELQPGVHGGAGYRQMRVARFSRALMKRCGLPLVYTNPNSAYRMVASLLYEAVTGEGDKDLERACKVVARRPSVGTETAKKI